MNEKSTNWSSEVDFEAVAQLVAAGQSGDAKALTHLYELYFPQIYYVCLKYLSDEEDASEATQEVFMTVYEKLDALENPRAFHRWIHRITYNTCIDVLRAKEKRDMSFEDDSNQKIQTEVIEENKEFLPEEYFHSQESRETLMRYISELPFSQRSSLIMYYFDELSVKEIAEIANVSTRAVSKRLYDARGTLRSRLESQLGEAKSLPVGAAAVLPVLTRAMRLEMESVAVHAPKAPIDKTIIALIQSVSEKSAKKAASVNSGTAAAAQTSMTTKVIAVVVAAAVLGGGAWGATQLAKPEISDSRPVAAISTDTIKTVEVTATPASVEPTVAPVQEPAAEPPAAEEYVRVEEVAPEQEPVPLRPYVQVAQTQMAYALGIHVSPAQLTQDYGVFAFDRTGQKLPLTVQNFEAIDFERAGRYLITFTTHDATGAFAQPVTVAVIVQ